jgi:catalase
MTTKSQYAHAAEIITRAHGVFGYHPSFRTLHATGHIYRGTFRATKEAPLYSRAAHLQGGIIPITVRYSYGGGDPNAAPNGTVGMATKFYLPDGRVTDLVMLNQLSFIARTGEELLALISAFRANAEEIATGQEGTALKSFLGGHPEVAGALALRKATPAPQSFAETQFHAIHAFQFVNAKEERRFAKYHFVPDAGITNQSVEALQGLPDGYLFTELEQRIAKGPVSFTLMLELGEPGDRTDDATYVWPEGRKRVAIGRLTLVGPITSAEIGEPAMMHDPTRLTDGIELSDDAILHLRRGTYEVSQAERTGGWRAKANPKLAGE